MHACFKHLSTCRSPNVQPYSISNVTDGFQDHHTREHIPQIEARDDDSDVDDPFEGLDGDNEDVVFTEF